MKIKLIAPAKKAEWGESFWDLKELCRFTGAKAGGVPLALPTLAALTPQGVEVAIIDENVESINFDEKVDLVGISFFTSLAPRAYEIADEFRARCVPVVLGGIHASMLPEEAIEHADSVVVGEAEDIWPKVVNDFGEGKYRQFYRAECFPNLDNSAIPRWDLLKTDDYCSFTVQTGRGCPNNCNFCSVTAFNGKRYRHKPIENVVEEMRALREIDPKRTIFFTDDNMLAVPDYARRLFEALVPLRIRWWCQASINKLGDDTLLELMYQSGSRQIFVGFESVSEKSIILMNKGRVNKVREYAEIVKKVHSHGIAICGSFILGNDSDDASIFKDTIKFVSDTNIAYSMVNILTPLPGTLLYQELKDENRLLHNDWQNYDGESVCFKPRLLSEEELSEGRNQVLQEIYSYSALYKRLSNLWNKGVLVRNRDGAANLLTKGRVLYTLKSLFTWDLSKTYFSLRGLWNREGTSIMSLLMSVNFHEYAFSYVAPRGADFKKERKSLWKNCCTRETAKLVFTATRDLLIRYLPQKVAAALVGKGDFAFLVHPLELTDISKKYRFLENTSEKTLAFVTKHLWPVVVSQITGFKTKSGKKLRGWMVACPLSAGQMAEDPKIAEKRVLQTARLAEKLGAKNVGLGAFSSIVTHGGTDLAGKVDMGLTTGNAYAAALAVQNAMKITSLLGLDMQDLTVAVIGAAGSVGSACSEFLMKNVAKLILVDRDAEALKDLAEKIRCYDLKVEASTELDIVREARAVIAVTSTAEGIIKANHLGHGAVVVDAAQPCNVCSEVFEREDILVINSGIAKVPGINCAFDIGLNKGEVYACLGEVLMLAWQEKQEHYCLGRVDPELLEETLEMAQEIGIAPADFRNPSGFIRNEDIRRFKDLCY